MSFDWDHNKHKFKLESCSKSLLYCRLDNLKDSNRLSNQELYKERMFELVDQQSN